MGTLFAGKDKVDEDILDELESILIDSDVGLKTTVKIIENIESRVARDKYVSISDLKLILKEEMMSIFSEKSDSSTSHSPEISSSPYVVLVVGVNGVGKTTTIGKIANLYKKSGKSVLVGAADTFRAAAVDQLKLWGERIGVEVVDHGMNTDPSSVAYDTVKKAVEDNVDVVLIDTAGRLHNKVGLMNELSKIKRTVQKFIPDAPHDVMLVLDGSTGQNAFMQAKEFSLYTDISSLTVTKLDGTAKGGIVLGISSELDIPIRFIGVGEGKDDIQLFDKASFVESFFRGSKFA